MQRGVTAQLQLLLLPYFFEEGFFRKETIK